MNEFSMKVFTYFFVGLTAFFSPILWAFWIVIGLVILDTVFGVMRAGKGDIRNIKSRRLFSLVIKITAYLLLVCLGQLASFIEPQIPFVKLVLFGIGFIEIKSIDENWRGLFGYSFIDNILQAFKFVKNIKREDSDK